MSTPDTLRYTKDHEWVRSSDTAATIGITDHAQGELGDIVFVELEPEGTKVAKGEVFGVVEAVKAVSELFMPLSGTITRHNPALEGDPALVNSDPYGEGWMIEIEPSNPEELDTLLSASDYEAHVA